MSHPRFDARVDTGTTTASTATTDQIPTLLPEAQIRSITRSSLRSIHSHQPSFRAFAHLSTRAHSEIHSMRKLVPIIRCNKVSSSQPRRGRSLGRWGVEPSGLYEIISSYNACKNRLLAMSRPDRRAVPPGTARGHGDGLWRVPLRVRLAHRQVGGHGRNPHGLPIVDKRRR
jgi:hypothetical protein